MVQDQSAQGLTALRDASVALTAAAAQEPAVTSVFSQFETSTPQLYVDIDRARAQALGVPPSRVFEALEVFLGSSFVNDFNFLGRTYRVTAQADAQFRRDARNIAELRTRSDAGGMVPLGSVATFRDVSGPTRVTRHNLYPAVEIFGDVAPGASSGQGLDAMEALAARTLPQGFSYEWTELAYQQRQAGSTAGLVFAFAVLVVFLVLAGQYESLTLPLAVVLIVPMCLLAAITGVLAPRAGQQHPHADRSRRSGGARVQERDPDRRVREAGRRSARARPIRGGRPRRTAASPADSDDVVRVHPRRCSAGDRRGRRRRSATGAGHRRVRGHARRHAVWPAAHAGVLRRVPASGARPPAIDNAPMRPAAARRLCRRSSPRRAGRYGS